MSNWIYRSQLTGVGNDLVLWIDIRYYANGAAEIFPWIENAFLRTSAPTNALVRVTIAIGGSTRFSQSIDIKARTRIPLLNGSSFSYWVGPDPNITPAHDVNYFRETRLVPNYAFTQSTSLQNGYLTTYSPNTLANLSPAMGSAGGNGNVDHPCTQCYLTSGATVTSYRAMMAFGLSAGSWSIHYRSAATHEPFSFTSESNTSFNVNPPASATGGANGTYAPTHAQGFAYIPYLVTGRWWFIDELLFIANYHFLDYQSPERFGPDAICNPIQSGSARLAAWSLRAYAQALAAVPDYHARRAELIAAWEANCRYYRAKFVDGGSYKTSSWGSRWVSPQGYIHGSEDYGISSVHWYSPGFMTSYLTIVFGVAWDYELPLSAAGVQDHAAVRNHVYKHIVGRAGLLAQSGYNWRHLSVYAYPAASKDGSTMYT
ncbi:MAG: hypothetical protein RML32_11445, partial [Gammaproteobacteria bacterium]|nr:hypothetical protein [Gammaproteobacteria bacterium]